MFVNGRAAPVSAIEETNLSRSLLFNGGVSVGVLRLKVRFIVLVSKGIRLENNHSKVPVEFVEGSTDEEMKSIRAA